MYIDGHEQDDIIKYWGEFIQQWKEYEKQMVMYNNDGKELAPPPGFTVPQIGLFHLILVIHDESTFYAHDHQKKLLES